MTVLIPITYIYLTCPNCGRVFETTLGTWTAVYCPECEERIENPGDRVDELPSRPLKGD